MSVENPLAHYSDDELVAEHSRQGANSHFLSEMLRRHKKASSKLGDRIWWLNLWLLVFTIAICGLTAVLVMVELGVMKRPHEQSAGRPWVLWVRTQLPGQETTTGVLSAYETRAECNSAESDAIAGLRAKFPTAKVEVGDETVWVWRENAPETMMTMDYYCLPDTVDPRGPTGK